MRYLYGQISSFKRAADFKIDALAAKTREKSNFAY